MITIEKITISKGIIATFRCRLKSLDLVPTTSVESVERSLLARKTNKPIAATPKEGTAIDIVAWVACEAITIQYIIFVFIVE